MKRNLSFFLLLAFVTLTGNLAFGQAQRTLGGTRLDLDDNVGNHIFVTNASSSLGINATGLIPNIGALLDLNSTTKGLLVPRMNAGQEAGVSTIAGMVLYNTTSNSLDVYNGVVWTPIGGGWSLAGNSGTNSAINYLGTNDAQDLVIRTTATERLRVLNGGNLIVSSSGGTAITIAGPAATSINANGTIQTTGNAVISGTTKMGATGTPVKAVYKLTVANFVGGFPGTFFAIGFGGSFGASGFAPVPVVGDAIIVNADPG
ncbi:MAG: hypothetical protein ACHQM6_01460, partial [Candidatus Kapaibacterium sp.]